MATIYVGHASLDENGNISGGTAGDQTGKEVCKRTWYSSPWDFMAIHPDADVREKHAAAIEAAIANNKIGYDQNQRNTLNTQAAKVSYDLSKITTACECDCSSLQHVAAIASGAVASSEYGSNGWTTSTMKAKLKAAGYKIVTTSKYLTSSPYCVRGAVYVKSGSHTVCGLTNGAYYEQTLEAAGIEITSSGTVKATEPAKSGPSSSIAGTYKVTASALNVRNGAGTSANSYGNNKTILVTIPKGTKVKNYGYYTTVNSTKWLYIQFTYGGVEYTGFATEKYLSKQ